MLYSKLTKWNLMLKRMRDAIDLVNTTIGERDGPFR
jgi:hypothetical protein